MEEQALKKIFKIAGIIASTDSIAEGWRYNNRDYSWERFVSERESNRLIRTTNRNLTGSDQSYYNVALRIYNEITGNSAEQPLDITWSDD